MNKLLFRLAGPTLTLALLATGCGHKTEPAPQAQLPTVSVKVAAIEKKTRTATEEVMGTVRAKLRANLQAKFTGRVEQMRVVPGQRVKAGELLVELDAREIQARLDQALALRQQAESDLKRFAALLDAKSLTQAEFDSAQARARTAVAAVTEAETLLSYAKVLAPFAGVITRKHADVGDLATPGNPLLELEDPSALRLEADVPEAVVGKLTLGDKLPVRVASLPGELEGVVSEIAPAADPGSRTFLVKLDLPNAAALRAGQFGRVAMPVGETAALRVPAAAVSQRGQMEIVFVVRDGKAQLRLVKTGKRLGGEVELVSGVDAGEKIVTEGAAGLLDGQPVEVR